MLYPMSLPEYDLNLKLDYAALGERVDAFLLGERRGYYAPVQTLSHA